MAQRKAREMKVYIHPAPPGPQSDAARRMYSLVAWELAKRRIQTEMASKATAGA